MAANTFSALTNPQPSATMGGLQQPAPVGRWIIANTGYHFSPDIVNKVSSSAQANAASDNGQAVYVNDSTGEISIGSPPAGQPAWAPGGNGQAVQVDNGIDRSKPTPEWQAVLAGSHGGSFFGPGLGGILGGLAAGSAFLPAAAAAIGAAGAGTAGGGASTTLADYGSTLAGEDAAFGAGAPGTGAAFAPIPTATGVGFGAGAGAALGSGITDEMLLTGQAAGAGGTAAGETAAGFSGAGAGTAGAGVPAAVEASGLPARVGNTSSAGDALNRIVNGTGTPGDYLTLGIPASGALASLLAGANASNASSKAADAQLQAAQAAIAEQRRQFDVTQANNAPFLATGTAANARLSQLLGTAPGYTGTDAGSLTKPFTSADLNADPVYNSGLQFGLDQGTKAINARAIAGGNYDSGATLKALTQFGNDYGSTKANDAFNRFQTTQGNTFNRLSGVSGTGQTAVGQVAAAGQNATNNISGLLTDQGSARSAGIVGGANAVTGAAGNINSLANNFSSNATLQALLGQRQPTYFANG
jgi:hypothetical protein